jgi:CheY-like chemotaxis protein
MNTARLLLVDDNPDNLEILGVLLAQKYEVWSYGSAADALSALASVEPDLLVLDIRMRPVDGVQCLETIRALPGYRAIPAIALTAFARDEEQKAFLDAGFQAVVTKPVLDDRQLITTIDRLLRAAAARQPLAAAGHERLTGNEPLLGAAS